MSGAAELAFERVAFVAGGRRVLDRIDLALAAGEHRAVVAPAGAGKSVLARLALGLLAPSSGTVRLGVVDTEDGRAARRARARVGAVLQGVSLLSGLTVEENLRLAQGWLAPSAREALRPRLERLLLDFGLEPLYGRPVETLSPGEQRRVELARALARDPDLLIVDEPFAGLDAEAAVRAEAAFAKALRRRPRAFLLLTQTPELAARLAPEALRLEGGRLRPQQADALGSPVPAS